MKLQLWLRNSLVQRLSVMIENALTQSDFDTSIMFLDVWNSTYKVIPYGLFNNINLIEKLRVSGHVENSVDKLLFADWVTKGTNSIEKDFNKGRKLVREIKYLAVRYNNSLAFNFHIEDLFVTAFSVFFVETLNTDELPFNFYFDPSIKLDYVFSVIRKYIIAVILINGIDDDRVAEITTSLIMLSTDITVLDQLMELWKTSNS